MTARRVFFSGNGQSDSRTFNFHMKPQFPKAVLKEFLLADLVNKLAEDQDVVLERISQVAASMDAFALKKVVRRYGGVRARKLFALHDDKGTT